MRRISSAGTLLLLSATAGAANSVCSAPPFGDTQERYQAMYTAFSNVVTDQSFPPDLLVRTLQAALIEACKAKFESGSRASYYANNISDAMIDSYSTTELANAWFSARNVAVAKEQAALPDDSRIYAIFQCIEGNCFRAVSYTFNTSQECRDYARSMTHSSPALDGRFLIAPGQWFECRSKHVDTWQAP